MFNFDIFGIKKRREEKRRAEEAARQAEMLEKKRRYQERKKLICDYLSAYRKEEKEKNELEYEKRKEEAEKKNSKCPKCGSTNVINHIKRTKGEIHGSGTIHGSSSSSYSLFYSSNHSYLSGRSKIDGELDTLPVNKCADCGNEWAIEKAKYEEPINIFSYSSTYSGQLFRRLEEYVEMQYNPNDVTEECNSLEEKREKYIKNISSNEFSFYFLKQRDVPRYMYDYLLFKGITEHWFNQDDLDPIFGFSDDYDEYSYQMPDELWEVVKQMLNIKKEI